jgi:flagellar motor switch protein FliN/FliY
MNNVEKKTAAYEKSDSAAIDKSGPENKPDTSDSTTDGCRNNLEVILDLPLEIRIELGRTQMVINDLLKLAQGSVIELGKPAGETLEVLANQRLIAKGEVVVANDKYGVRLTEIISPIDRLESLK